MDEIIREKILKNLEKNSRIDLHDLAIMLDCSEVELVNEVSKEMESADGFIVGSPVHYAAASGAATSFLDRLFYSTDKNHLRHMFGASIVSCRRGGASAAFDQLNKYFTKIFIYYL